MSLQIRKGKVTELDPIFNVIRLCSEMLVEQGMDNWTRYTIERVNQILQEGEMFVLVHEEEIVGTIKLSQQTPKFFSESDKLKWKESEAKALYFTALGVIPHQQKKNYGGKLIEFAERHAKKNEIKYLRMTMLSVNKPLASYYLKRGFQIRQTRFVEELQLELSFGEKEL